MQTPITYLTFFVGTAHNSYLVDESSV